MRLLKQYSVLYDLYRRRVVKLKILTLICLLFVPLAFGGEKAFKNFLVLTLEISHIMANIMAGKIIPKHRQDIIFGYEGGLDNIYKHQIQRMIDFNLECAEKRDGGSIVMNTDYLNTLPEIKNKTTELLNPRAVDNFFVQGNQYEG